MTRERKTEMLSETICVTVEEARAALEASEWRLLDAARLLERQSARARKAEADRTRRESEWDVIGAVRALIARLARRRVASRPDDAASPKLSASALAPLMLMSSVYAWR